MLKMRKNTNIKIWFLYFCVFIFIIFASFLLNFIVYFNNKSNFNQSNFAQLNHPTYIDVKNVDTKLKNFAKNYVHKKTVPFRVLKKTVSGPEMHSILEIVQSTNVLIEPKNPCYGNSGKNQLLLILMPITGNNVNRRNLIRQTYGSKLKNNLNSSFYFVTAQDYDLM